MYVAGSLILGGYYPIADLFTTSIYVHYFVYLLYGIDHDPAVNLEEMVMMEGVGNVAM